MKPSRYGPFPYSPIIHRPPLKWPNGAHVALWVIPNIEFFALDEKVPPGSGGTGVPVPDVPTWSSRDYGNRVGVFRLMEVLDRHGIRATVALNSELTAAHPAIMTAIAEANSGDAIAYGADPWTEQATRELKRLAGASGDVYLVLNGSGANVLGLGLLLGRHEAVICADSAHINTD